MSTKETRPLGQAFADFSKEFSKEYCLAPDAPRGCKGTIVRAHTVQRPSLVAIAERGHVLQMSVHPTALSRTGGLPEPKEIGVKRGSTFTGFCGQHDAEIFRPLEASPFIGSGEQLRLLTYRCACRELFQKRAAAQAIPPFSQLAKGRSLLHKLLILKVVRGMVKGTKAGLRSMERHKRRLDGLLTGKDQGDPRGVVLRLSAIPQVMCAGGIYPDEDFDGRPIQDLSKTRRRMDFLAFSMFASGGKGFAVFSWEPQNDRASRALVESLLSKPIGTIADRLVLFAFEYIENTLFSKRWWEALDGDRRGRFQRAVIAGLPFVPSTKGRRLALERPGLAQWSVDQIDQRWTG